MSDDTLVCPHCLSSRLLAAPVTVETKQQGVHEEIVYNCLKCGQQDITPVTKPGKIKRA